MNKKTSEDEKIAVKTNTIELNVEELEERLAPGRTYNHNETLVRDVQN